MKKKIFSLLALLVMIGSLTGCIKYNATLEIGEDKSMNFSIIYAMANSVLEMSDDQDGSLLDEKQKQSLLDQGFTISDYKDDTNTGFTISKNYTNIDDVSSETDVEYSLSKMFEETADSKMFKVVKGTDKNTYYANFIFDSSDSSLNSDESEDETSDTESKVTVENGDNTDLSNLDNAIASSFDLKFVVKLPNAALESNATEKSEDGKQLTWKLDTDKMDTISFKFELNNPVKKAVVKPSFFNKTNMPVIIGVGIVFIIAVIILVIVYIKGNKKPVTNEVQTDTTGVAPVPSVAPVQPVAPIEPVQPVTPIEPVQPATPVAPVQPAAPVEPVQPATPVEPVQPAETTDNSTII